MNNFQFDLKTLWKLLNLAWILPLFGIILVNLGNINFDKLGPFGDFIAGSTVPILTFVSFLAIVITLTMQKEQLEMQREELRNSIDEMQATRKEFEEQNKTLSKQRFDNTYFQMISLHNNIVSSLYFNGQNPKTGRSALPRYYHELKSQYQILQMQQEFNGKDEISRIRMTFAKFLEKYEGELGHYFRNLHHTLKFLDESDIDDKETYIGIIKAQLSSHEQALILYYSLTILAYDFLMLIKKYNLLQNLNPNTLILDTHFEEVYKEMIEDINMHN